MNLQTLFTQARNDFPMLNKKIDKKFYVYLDNAATTLKPQSVIRTLNRFYRSEYATVHRGIYRLSQKATEACENVRQNIAQFIHAKSENEIVFVRGTTEAINMVAYSYGRPFITKGKEILISETEHHANIVPWQRLCEENGCRLVPCPVNEKGELILAEFKNRLSRNTALVAIAHASNVLGTIHPIRKMTQLAHQCGAKVLIDGAQGIAHDSVDVQAIDCDFYCFSGHKIYGPTGIGVLYGKYDILDQMSPFLTGGDMIETVTFEKTTFQKPPLKFEAGTPAFAQIIGLGAAIDYINHLGIKNISDYETDLLHYATSQLETIDGLRIIGTAVHKSSLISFVIDDVHPHDIGTIVDQEGVAIRVGHHCSQPTMKRFRVPATARASLSFYNNRADILCLVKGIKKVKEVML